MDSPNSAIIPAMLQVIPFSACAGNPMWDSNFGRAIPGCRLPPTTAPSRRGFDSFWSEEIAWLWQYLVPSQAFLNEMWGRPLDEASEWERDLLSFHPSPA
jgi:hypothetical protein